MLRPARRAKADGGSRRKSSLRRCRAQSRSESPLALHRVRRLLSRECAGEIILDLLLRLAAVLFAELYADARRALALCALRRHPDDASGDRQLLILAHEIEQHEHLVAEAIIAVRRNEQSAVSHIGHEGKVQRALILDGEREQTWFVGTRAQIHFTQLTARRPPVSCCIQSS